MIKPQKRKGQNIYDILVNGLGLNAFYSRTDSIRIDDLPRSRNMFLKTSSCGTIERIE